ncbi:MAG: hypothetical protein DRN20_01910 [Thermoplasmata archaeon]|nr:MAG: hypothetical protein DRN20_01910 [Thermoplasmata archaeon]
MRKIEYHENEIKKIEREVVANQAIEGSTQGKAKGNNRMENKRLMSYIEEGLVQFEWEKIYKRTREGIKY